MKKTKFPKKESLALLPLCFIISGLISVSLGQDINWDLKNYHYYNPYSLIHNRLDYDINPAQKQTYFNPLAHLPFYSLVNNLNPKVVGFILGGIHGLNFWLIFVISFYFFDYLSRNKRFFLSLAASITGFCGSMNLSELGTTMNDNLFSILILGSFLFIIRNIKGKESKKNLLISGILIGSAAGLKLSNMLFVFGLGATILIIYFKKFKKIISWVIGSLTGFLITNGYWMFKLYQKFRNPFFPFFNNIFKSSYYTSTSALYEKMLPRTIIQRLFYPFFFATKQNYVNQLLFRDIRFAVIYSLSVIVIVFFLLKKVKLSSYWKKLKNKRTLKALIIFFLITYVAWQQISSVYRFLIPLELLSPITIAVLSSILIKNKKSQIIFCTIIFIVIILTVNVPNWGRTDWSESYFGAEINNKSTFEESIIIIASGKPMAYVIPFFPEKTRFIRIESNILFKNSSNSFTIEINETIKNHNSTIYLLTPQEINEIDNELLGKYNLRLSEDNTINQLDNGSMIVASNLEKAYVLRLYNLTKID